MTYDEAVKWYHSFEKFGVVPGLERVRSLCSRLGDPQDRFACVHVTGTNGKGSVCTETANVLKEAGYRTALYTSPEVLDFRERMQINGEMIPEGELCLITEKVKLAVEELNRENVFPTQFEVLTAAAFLWFAESACDIAVLETGLGGRFDATNIVTPPLVCAIVSVSLDHVAILGDTVGKIAFEKSGIIKKHTPVIVAASVPAEAKNVIADVARQQESTLTEADEKRIFDLGEPDDAWCVGYRGRRIRLPFFGYHQVQNAAVTVKICEALADAGLDIPIGAVVNGIGGARIPARTEILCRRPFVLLDGCHNDASTQGLSDVLHRILPDKRILAVMGMMADKDCSRSAANLIGHFAHVITVRPSNPRAMDPSDFAELIRGFGAEAEVCEAPADGIDKALEMIEDYDALVVCGSLYLAADVRAYLRRKLEYYNK